MNHPAFQTLVTYVKSIVSDTSITPICIIFYAVDTNVKHFLDSNYDGLKSVGIYEYDGGELTHRLFTYNGTTFMEDTNNRKPVADLYFYDVEFALLHDVRDQYSNVAAFHMFTDYNASPTGASSDLLPLHQSYYYYLANHNNSSINIPLIRTTHTYVIDGGGDCPPPCPPAAATTCIYTDPIDGPQCAGAKPPCPHQTFSSTSVSNNILTPSNAAIYFDSTLAYTVRDTLLVNSNFGRKYINYYYSLTGILTVSDYSSMCTEVVNIMPAINNAVTEILNPSTYGNTILINSSFATNLTNVINDFENLHGDGNYKAILENVKADITAMTGMTVDQVRSAYF
jgi:hypothetical protein